MNKKTDIRVRQVDFEVRSDEAKDSVEIVGYALKFESPSEDLGFTEYIKRGALDQTDMDNVVALVNHDYNLVLGRTHKNLKLEVDDIGLRFTVQPTETSYTKDLVENMRAGLIDKCSFAFTIADEENAESWYERDGKYIREVNKIDRLYDVSVVTTPAYEDTVALLSTRSKNALNDEIGRNKRTRELEIMEMEQAL